ncbi:TetR/AcrR family transcriptional regulator [Actinomadura sp. NPDC047616]|uniref:TetR/AcrR family transcriptional regulator n=1 Tax=Actinomadura sp. NPDC047616 TaxID=3155914 RepID=UPI0033DDAE61
MNKKADRGRATRDRLLDIALRLFAEHGYEGTSIEAVLAETQVSRGALYHHFPGKDALFAAVLERVETGVGTEVSRAAAGAPDAVAALRAGCLAWVRLAGDPVVRRIVLLDAPAVLGWHRWREIEARHGFGMLKAALGNVAAEGRLPAERVEVFAHMLLAAMNEVALLIAVRDGDAAAIADGQAAVGELLDRLLAA